MYAYAYREQQLRKAGLTDEQIREQLAKETYRPPPTPAPPPEAITPTRAPSAYPAAGAPPTQEARLAWSEVELARLQAAYEGARTPEAYERYRRFYEREYLPAHERRAELREERKGRKWEKFEVELRAAGLTDADIHAIKGKWEYITATSRTDEEAAKRWKKYMEYWDPIIAAAPTELAEEKARKFWGYTIVKWEVLSQKKKEELIFKQQRVAGKLITEVAPSLKKPFSLKLMEAAYGLAGPAPLKEFAMPHFGLPKPPEVILGRAAMGGAMIVGAAEETGMWLARVAGPLVGKPGAAAGYAPPPSPMAILAVPEYREKYWPALGAAPALFALEAKAMAPPFKLAGKAIKTVVQASFKGLAKFAPPAVKAELKLHPTISRFLGVKGEYARIYTPFEIGAKPALGKEEEFVIKYVTKYKGGKIVPLTDSMKGMYARAPWAQVRIDVGKVLKPFTEPTSVWDPIGKWQTIIPEEQIVSFEAEIFQTTGLKSAVREITTWVKYSPKVTGVGKTIPFRAFDPVKFATMKPFKGDIKGGISYIQRLVQRQKIPSVQPPAGLFYVPVSPVLGEAWMRGISSALGVGAMLSLSFKQAQALTQAQVQALTQAQTQAQAQASIQALVQSQGQAQAQAQAQVQAQIQAQAQAQAQMTRLAQHTLTPKPTPALPIPLLPFDIEGKKLFARMKVPRAKFKPFERVWPIGRIEKLFEAPRSRARKVVRGFDARGLKKAFKLSKTGRRR